jgi:hypothetical protein
LSSDIQGLTLMVVLGYHHWRFSPSMKGWYIKYIVITLKMKITMNEGCWQLGTGTYAG